MNNVVINQKNYVVHELGFKDMVHMEDMGFSVIDMMTKKQVFSLATAFTGVVAGCERAEAEELCQQHILGGGDIQDIYVAFMKAADESAFFKKLLNVKEEPEKKTTKTSQKKEQ